MQHVYKIALFMLSFWFCQPSVGQDKPIDSLDSKTYEELETNFNKQYTDSLNVVIYAKAYLKKAMKSNDTIRIANAYYYLSDASPSNIALLYCDSIIDLTKNIKGNNTFPVFGYLQKGNIYYQLGQYKMALNYFLECYDASISSNNEIFSLAAQQNIGLLKNKIGEREEALEIFKSHVNYIENSTIQNKDYHLINGYYALADSYVYNKKNDSASVLINKGKQKAFKAQDSLMSAYYVYLSGVNLFYLKEYKESIDSLKRSKQIFYEEILNATTNLYLGKSYDQLNKKNEAILYYQEVDSFLQKTKNITPELVEIYQPLIKFQKGKGNLKQQLYYINNLLKFDSILNENNKYLSKKIVRKYEIPSLISEKEAIINDLKDDYKNSKAFIYFLYVILLLFIIVAVIYINKTLTNKKRFEALIKSQNAEKNELKTPENIIQDSTATLTGIPEALVKEVLLKLDVFEKKDKFIRNYTLASLAKELKTNSSYLSKIINATKKSNFSNYLNDLRIDYVMLRLTNDKKFRSYTINAIANEVGFNAAQSFSKAFYKKTGLHPSYFIKKLEKERKG